MPNEADADGSADTEEGGPVKSFLDHLEDLRWTLIKCASAIGLAVLVCLLAGNYVVGILMRPLQRATVKYSGTNQVVTIRLGTNNLTTITLDPAHEKFLANYQAAGVEVRQIEKVPMKMALFDGRVGLIALLDPVITKPTWTAVIFEHSGLG